MTNHFTKQFYKNSSVDIKVNPGLSQHQPVKSTNDQSPDGVASFTLR